MIVEILLFALVVKVMGLLSMTIVTGDPLNKTFKDTKMMAVFFCTGILVSLLAYATMIAQSCQACSGDSYTKKQKESNELKLIKNFYAIQ